ELLAQLVRREGGRVEDAIGVAAESCEQLTLATDAGGDVAALRHRVRPAGLAEAPYQRLVRGVEVDDEHAVATPANLVEHARQLVEEPAAARVDAERDARDLVARLAELEE